jgi:hypothetical protein
MSIERVNYFDGQFLRVEDFQDEQAYQIAMRRRHNISQHSWGIVQGLEPRLVEGTLYLTPGLAVDKFGRELVVDRLQRLAQEAFVDLDATQLEVWIEYATAPTAPPPKGYQSGGANGIGQYYRVAEQPRIRLSKPSPNATPRLPAGTTPTDLEFDATRAAPEDRRWPVFLGKVTFDKKNADVPYTVDLAGRPYAGLVGEGVTAPSGRARVQIGSEDPADPVRFAVFIPAADEQPRFAMEAGKLAARGEATVEGNLTVSGGSLEIGVGPAASPQPWRLYRVREPDAGKFRNELRIEMGSVAGEANQIVFGVWSVKDNKFKPCLTVADDGTVTVSGNLVVQGKLNVNPENVVAGQLTSEARALVATGAVSSVSAAGVMMNQIETEFFKRKVISETALAQQRIVPAAPEATFEAKARELAAAIEKSPGNALSFVRLIRGEFKKAADSLKSALEDK